MKGRHVVLKRSICTFFLTFQYPYLHKKYFFEVLEILMRIIKTYMWSMGMNAI